MKFTSTASPAPPDNLDFDTEALRIWQKRKRKKGALLLAGTLIAVPVITFFSLKTNSQSVTSSAKDTNSPIIALKKNQTEIAQNSVFDYKYFIDYVFDESDPDNTLKDTVTFSPINTAKPGEQNVLYSVKDKSGNEGTAVLKVIVKEAKLSDSAIAKSTSKESLPADKKNAKDQKQENKSAESSDSSKEKPKETEAQNIFSEAPAQPQIVETNEPSPAPAEAVPAAADPQYAIDPYSGLLTDTSAPWFGVFADPYGYYDAWTGNYIPYPSDSDKHFEVDRYSGKLTDTSAPWFNVYADPYGYYDAWTGDYIPYSVIPS